VIGFGAIGATASPLPEYPFVFAAGAARLDTPPDMVRLSFTIVARNRDPKLAAAAADATFSSVLNILAAGSIQEGDIDASGIDKTLRTHWDENRSQSVPDGYQVSRKVKVIGRDLAKYPQMARSLLELSNTADFSAAFDRSDRAKIEADVLDSAAQDARTRADRLAAQFGRRIGSVHAIAEIAFESLPAEFGLSYSGSAMNGMPSEMAVTAYKKSAESLLAPAKIRISKSVNVVYELQPGA